LSRYFKAKLTSNLTLNSKNILLTFEPLEPAIKPRPGQFYMIEAGESYDPLLKRPFSYMRRTPETLQFLCTVRGKGTSLMKQFRQGRVVNMTGPLGNGYPETHSGYTPLLIAGGTGVASLFSLAEECGRKSFVIYGARCRDDLMMLEELGKLGHELITCTDDCSFGKEGLVTDILKAFLAEHSSSLDSFLVFACGPKPMLRVVSETAKEKGVKGFLSLEENMACGFGACQGCAVRTIHGYKRVCKEGPVFPIEEIVW
jgi:dihydroorotate dehydrogenase electron transfer subunit